MKNAQRIVYEHMFADDEFLTPAYQTLTTRLDVHSDLRAVLTEDADLTEEGVAKQLNEAGIEIGSMLDEDIAAVEKRLGNLRSSEHLQREELPPISDFDRGELLQRYRDLISSAAGKMDLLANPDAHKSVGLALLHTPREITGVSDDLLNVYRETLTPYKDRDNAFRVNQQIGAHESLLKLMQTERGNFPSEN
ncbi:MAG: hypothetical protein NXH95_02565 [Pseudomonadaceae bacterium]|nr:hypothetical protein [Pseudomonadaceae bacterium]